MPDHNNTDMCTMEFAHALGNLHSCPISSPAAGACPPFFWAAAACFSCCFCILGGADAGALAASTLAFFDAGAGVEATGMRFTPACRQVHEPGVQHTRLCEVHNNRVDKSSHGGSQATGRGQK